MTTDRVLLLSKALVVGAYQRKAELIAELGDVDLTVAVPPRWIDGGLERRLERKHDRGYDLVETAIVRPGDFHLHFYPKLGRLLEDRRPALVHIDEEPYNLATWLALRAARRVGARTIFFTWQNLSRRYPLPFRWIERAVHRRADGAIAGSRTAAEVLRGKGYAGPLWVIPQFGVDESIFKAAAEDPRQAAGRDRELVIGYAGRLVPAKGLDLLLEALAGSRDDAEQLPPWRLEIVGEGPELGRLQTMAESRGIADRVRWKDWLPSTEMPNFYRRLDVLVLPSRSTPSWIEQFGRVLIEAMACGVVCVGSDSGEIPHVLGDAGLVFPEGDAPALRSALARLALAPEYRFELARLGRSRVEAMFTMRRVAEATLKVYGELLEA